MDLMKAVELDLSKLPLYQPRSFLPEKIDFQDIDSVCALYKKLLDMPVKSWQEMEKFLACWSELESALGEHGSVLSIRMTCQTDDAARSEAYRRFTQELLPAIKPLDYQLKIKFISFYDSVTLPRDRYVVLARDARADIEVFRDENVELQKREDGLIQDYQTVCGGMTVEFDGKLLTMPQIRRKLSEADRSVREKAWRAMMKKWRNEADKLDDIFDQMILLRHKIAVNAGFEDYRDYKFKEWHRFDYTPQDCFDYHQAVEQKVVPAVERIFQQRKKIMKLDSLRPWDFDVTQSADPYGKPALSPFKEADELIGGIRKIVGKLHPEFDKQIGRMQELGLLDLVSRKGKAPGGYQASLNERREQFIFGNTVGSNSDVYLLLHEGGHAFHSSLCRDEPLVMYRHAPIEFCEVASQAMELLGSRYLNEFYSEDDAKRAWREKLEETIFYLIWVANIDAFQHWIYEHPVQDRNQRRKAWLEINERFYGKLYDWSELAEFRETMWQRQLHIFQCPFYYIEYGIAQLGALGIWQQSQKDSNKAVENYCRALSLGGSKPLPELFAAAGLKFDFSENTVGPLVDAVMREWEKVFDS
ncbi:MAG: Oligoendopeptidase F, plasmid [Planctomycetes bacterium ADurb.Bin401]|nr:MAG: Oligoendopeptidase F, plasmid [Planctomycetes bacterium ADurb.Bin401]